MVQDNPKISGVIITLNEEKKIESAIKSLSFCDEIIIVDSFSTDKTITIAKKLGAITYSNPFKNFSDQRNFGAKKASNNWIFALDADEQVSLQLKKEIESFKWSKYENISALKIKRSFHFLGKPLEYGGTKSDIHIRMYNKTKCEYINPVHEKIKINLGEVKTLNSKIEHHTFNNLNHYIKKQIHYAEIQAKKLFDKNPNKRITIFHLIIKPHFKFFKSYILKRGFLDGFPGFVRASTQAITVVFRYIKFWQLKNNH